MSAASKTILFLVILGAAAGALMLLNRDTSSPGLPTKFETVPEPLPDTAPPPAEPIQAGTAPAVTLERRSVEDGDKSGDEFGQGVHGVLADPTGNPPPATQIYLMETAGADLFKQLLQAQKGVRIMPVARAETDATGHFALGVQKADPNKKYEIRVVSDLYMDHQVPNLTIQQDQWYDAGQIGLQRGATVYGRVTIEGSGGLPVQGARVMVVQNSMYPSISPTPGREDGLVAEVDQTGAFRLENVPPGIVNISAVAPNYARIEKPNTSIQAAAQNQVLFELPSGVAIAGVVVDAQGNPVSGAKIDATAISSKTPATGKARSDSEGRWEIIGLIESPYMLAAIAPGYVRNELKPIQSGDMGVEVVLEEQLGARIRVYDKNGRVLPRYNLTVKTHFPGQEQFGNTEIPPAQVRAESNGTARITGLDPGNYVFQVVAHGHCKAFSDPFKVAVGEPEPLVEVRLNEGGALEGHIVDNRGQPVRGVRVETLPNHLDENPFTSMFKSIIPFKITQTNTTTDSKGHYLLTLLTPGSYQLKVTHSEFYDVNLKNNEVAAGQRTSVEQITMERGTVVSGVVRVDGAAAGQVKVTVSSASSPESPAPTLFSCDAISDNEGKFTLGKRVPPGRYQIMAARQTLANPLMQIADFHRTKQEITLGRGQDKFFIPLSISSQ